MDLQWIEPGRIRPLRRTEYDQLIAAGAFGPEERVELVRGFILRMPPIKPPHGYSLDALAQIFIIALNGRAHVRIQGAFAASDDSEPQPDLLVYPLGDYRHENPGTALLLIEVSDSSLRFDRGPKLDLYAEAGVPEYWIVNLVDGVVEVHDQPTKSGFKRSRVLRKSDRISPSAFPDLVIDVSSILP